jgi:uncharacterized protein YpiB (UPF0302 family)
MNVDLRFDLGNRVLIKGESTNNIGEIICCKVEKAKFNDEVRVTIRYQVKRTPYSQPWYEENQLSYADDKDIKVSPETDKFLSATALQYVINISLDKKDRESFLELTNQLNELHKKKVTE